MKYLRMSGLLALAIAALLVFAGGASATALTAPSGTVFTGVAVAESESHVTLHGVEDVTCKKKDFKFEVEQHGFGITVKAAVTTLDFTECSAHVKVLKNGTIEVHPLGAGNGTVTSSGAEITVELTTIFGNVHCILATNNTDIGQLTAAPSDTGHATLHTNGAIPVKAGSGLCGSSWEWTGSDKILSPTGLRVHGP